MNNKKLVCGVGINDSDYVVTKNETIIVNGQRKNKQVWMCLFYRTWRDMIRRCYSVKEQERHSTYRGCSVHDEWLTFSKFKAWMVQQDWENKHLDKDILIQDNKVYSPDTCVFISPMVNTFVIDCGASRGKFMIGVSYHNRDNKFQSYCNNPFTKKLEHLGYYITEIEAHQVWKKRKLELAHELAAIQTDKRVAKALIDRYS